MKLLVVEDDLVLSDVIGFTLRRAGFEIITTHDGRIAYDLWQKEKPDLVILDIKLPGLDGLALCRRIRAQHSTPIIILSVQGTDNDVVNGLEIGADDYIAKPFSPVQLIARVRAVLRRTGLTAAAEKLAYGELTLDVARREVQHRLFPEPVKLTRLECRLLEILMLNGGRVLANNTLIDFVWGAEGGDNVMLKQLMHRLRQKIKVNLTNPTLLENVPGVGYALVERVGNRRNAKAHH